MSSSSSERIIEAVANELVDIFQAVTTGRDLSREQARWVFGEIMQGSLEPATVGALVGALLTKGECADELIGAAEAMRGSMIRIAAPENCIDTCGTGGDGVSTFNVSTTAGIVAAAAGVPVAKHGNRSTTRKSGSTEVLEKLGINTEASPGAVEQSLADVGIAYLNARTFHPAMKHAAPVRAAIPVRTIFNLLGPLTNPAGARRQLLGVPRPELTDLIAEVLLGLGAVHAWVVHGNGMCDVTATGTTRVVEVKDGTVRTFELTPETLGLERASVEDLMIQSPDESCAVVESVLAGKHGPARDHTLLNAAAAIVVGGRADDAATGLAIAIEQIDSGAAAAKLAEWRTVQGISK